MKPWYQSKTVWFNILMAVLSGLEASFSVVQPMFAANIWPLFAAGVTLVNLVLRAISTQALTTK
jgi:hypothetical protein